MCAAKTQLILLGTGNPNPDPEHSGCSLALVVNGTSYLVDFGAGLVRQAAALTPRYGGEIEALDSINLKIAFLTHLHSDHTVGYPDLILTPWVMGRVEPLEVYGPEGIGDMTDNILKAYQQDIENRLDGLEPANDQGWRVNAHEIGEGVVYQDQNVEVEAFLVKHGHWSNAFGFRFRTSDKVIVISGDTAPCENIRVMSHGVDILVHEVYSKKTLDWQDEAWKRYHLANHTSTHELAEMVLYHTLFWGSSEQDILDEIAEIYDGPVVVGSDLQVFE
jgi:ribonuclease Z